MALITSTEHKHSEIRWRERERARKIIFAAESSILFHRFLSGILPRGHCCGVCVCARLFASSLPPFQLLVFRYYENGIRCWWTIGKNGTFIIFLSWFFRSRNASVSTMFESKNFIKKEDEFYFVSRTLFLPSSLPFSSHAHVRALFLLGHLSLSLSLFAVGLLLLFLLNEERFSTSCVLWINSQFGSHSLSLVLLMRIKCVCVHIVFQYARIVSFAFSIIGLFFVVVVVVDVSLLYTVFCYSYSSSSSCSVFFFSVYLVLAGLVLLHPPATPDKNCRTWIECGDDMRYTYIV